MPSSLMQNSGSTHPQWQILRDLRQHLGISQIEISQRVGVSQSALSRWENRGKGLNDEVLAKIEQIIRERVPASAPERRESAQDGRACSRIRTALGLKQQKVADLAGINRTTLSMFENGYQNLSAQDFENLLHVLEGEIQSRGYHATGVSADGASHKASRVSEELSEFARLLGPAKSEALRTLESQLQTFGDPAFRLKIAEDQIERDKEALERLTHECSHAREQLAEIEAENLDHKRHKELLGDFAAAQQSLITCQNEKILALEGNPVRDFGKGVRPVRDIDPDIAEARRKVSDCHHAIITELERKSVPVTSHDVADRR